ncbi:hypothetical protein ABIE26_003002 [Pedobacter africanus]|uniref:hypothetical protein n=1 Tax=Pedobacter africanus TaxID=151894 RepID=UPI003393D429
MKTANSLSGGKTSSYLAFHHPADFELFSLVCIDDHNAGNKIDKKLKQMVNDRLQKYCPHQKEFVATSEDPATIQVIFDLEQLIGREIIWLRGMGWEEMLRVKCAIPNINKRFCTTVLKVMPIFEFLYMYTDLPIAMRIGYRYDEASRANRLSDTMKFPTHCEFREGSNTWIHRWMEIIWRVPQFPLIDNKVFHHHVQSFWRNKSIRFPADSNCQNCFWKHEQQLRKNYDTNPDIMKWAAVQESILNRTFKEKYSLIEIARLGLQLDFFFGTGSGCHAGFCTD